MGLIKNLCKGDPVIWVVFIALCLISLLEVFSATSSLTYSGVSHWVPITRHCIILVSGMAIVVLVHRISYTKFRIVGSILYPVVVLLLAYITFRGALVNGAARWFTVLGFQFQPSELAKPSVMILVAIILAWHRESGFKSKSSFRYIMWITIIMCLCILRENFSTALILFIAVYLMMFVGQIPKKQMLKITSVFLFFIALFLAVVFLSPDDAESGLFHRFSTWKGRIVEFVTPVDCAPEDYDVNENAQTAHANIAIASSNFIGCMPGNSVQRDFLSQAYSDFIFAIIVEELGLLGAVMVVALYIILLIRAGKIAQNCDKPFPQYLVLGLAIILVLQAFVNMFVAVGLFPVTGQPLPLISRGGTATWINCAYIGMILSVSRYNEQRKLETKMEEVTDDASEKQPETEPAVADKISE